MKKTLLLLILLALKFAPAKAQWVTIPDANFVTWLTQNYPTCMNGNQMDTTCANITSATSLTLSNQNISDLTGVQYFTGITYLICHNNQITSLPSLPANLQYLYCYQNQLTSLPSLPANLYKLYCDNNQLTSLPSLPPNLQELYCYNNQLTSLPSLPAALQYLYCYNNQLTSLPSLLANLQRLYCYNNQLTSLPSLPASLQVLYCYKNQLTSLPNLPANIYNVNCNNNQLTSLPSLPANLHKLNCDSNNISCFPIFPISLDTIGGLLTPGLSIAGNPFTCLPNYLNSMNSTNLAYPLCVNGDTVNNPTNCASASGIAGFIYTDANSNCIKDNAEQGVHNISLKQYDINGNLLAQTYSFSNGVYNFSDSIGTYTIVIDTIGKPYTYLCNYPGLDSTVTLSIPIPLISNVNFDVACKPGFDVGVQSPITTGPVFPGLQHRLKILGGDISNWYNFNCAAGIAGAVQVTVTGAVTYNGIANGALTPSVAGNVFTYTITDFGNVNFQSDFGLLFTTDTTAQAGDTICVSVTVTPTVGDNNPNNNTYQHCYQVVNSYDPNMKEVYPVNVLPGYDDWFTYTIHFQNTGNAPAVNIRLSDILDTQLNLNTFEVLCYSHEANTTVNGNILTVSFNNIMLPDSTTNYEGSMGYFQYRIKPISNLPNGSHISNTAYIFFDYNAPIVTNTTKNIFGVNGVQLNTDIFEIYPNPSTGIFTFKDSKNIKTIEVYNLMGELILSQGNAKQINLSEFPKGIYVVKINGQFVNKLVKE